jgi:hypothetical protein
MIWETAELFIERGIEKTNEAPGQKVIRHRLYRPDIFIHMAFPCSNLQFA